MSTQPQQINKEEVERELQSLGDEYNANVEKLTNAEVTLNNTKDRSFQLLRQLYKQRKYSDPSTHAALSDLEAKYEASEAEISRDEKSHYEIMQECFRQLQKLRQLHTNYLVAVINSLQKEIAELKQTPAVSPNSMPAPGKVSPPSLPVIREDNLA